MHRVGRNRMTTELYQIIESYNSVIIFGASTLGTFLHNTLKHYCDEVAKPLRVADNSLAKQGGKMGVITPGEASNLLPDALWIIASSHCYNVMHQNLISIGVKEENILHDLPDEITEGMQQALENERKRVVLKRLTPCKSISFDVDIAFHCNLNCAGCFAFSTLVDKPLFYDFETFDSDMARVSFLMRDSIDQIKLMGGEPLLNPEIDSYIKSTRKHFPNTQICIFTNGTLIPKMPASFWNTCNENKISFIVTKYPIDFDYDVLPAIFANYGIEVCGFIHKAESHNIALDPDGKFDPYESFTNCYFANFCIRLRNGKFATCATILNIDFFNQAFNTNMYACPDDYIDIYEAQSGQEILDFLCKPVPFCRFCDIDSKNADIPWHISKREITEWVSPRWKG